jgi:hypothetical protein
LGFRHTDISNERTRIEGAARERCAGMALSQNMISSSEMTQIGAAA